MNTTDDILSKHTYNPTNSELAVELLENAELIQEFETGEGEGTLWLAVDRRLYEEFRWTAQREKYKRSSTTDNMLTTEHN
tara:strand:+ start:287 stop:526 length:240 start_codon:yes stop_codon:yes gene_type:complete